MRFEWTPAVTRAFQSAQTWACRLGAAELEPVHLLYGLAAEEEGRVTTLLTRAATDPAALRQWFAQRPATGAPQPADTPLPFSAGARAALDGARELAGELSLDSAVPSEALLVALLRQDEALRRSLGERGLVFADLEGEVLASQRPPLRLDEPLALDEPTEQVDTARILDAGANRAREALRVLEDFCRFALDDAFLSAELKQLRHELTGTVDRFDRDHRWGLGARDTLQDVGITLSTPREGQRHSLREVALVNCKRLQEALRSLEEFGKLRGPELGLALEKLRYRSYTLERALVLGATARRRLADVRLCVLVTGSQCTADLKWTIQEAVAGGAQMIQLREKNLDDGDLLERARDVRRWTRAAAVLFLVNDRPDIARLAEADGVHVGQGDLPVKEVRRIVGPDALIGVSTCNLMQVRQAVLDGASYIGVGPTFPSGTKTFAEFPGLDFVREALAETSLPAFVIGGVTLETIGPAVAAGARRVAVSQAICKAEDPQRVAAELRRALQVP